LLPFYYTIDFACFFFIKFCREFNEIESRFRGNDNSQLGLTAEKELKAIVIKEIRSSRTIEDYHIAKIKKTLKKYDNGFSS